jgi:hypothetical protein
MVLESIFCPQCGQRQPVTHLHCLRCGDLLPTELLESGPPKLARFFAGMRVDDGDPEGAYLRVSCYLRDQIVESAEGSVVVPGHHVRFSVWVGSEARCVVSLPEWEARDLARFISEELPELPVARPETYA